MRLLLDTHVAIWALASPNLIAPEVARLIADPANTVHVSAASIWEIAIKFAPAKHGAPPFSAVDALGHFSEAGYVLLDISAEHAAAVENLPRLHPDPFDRLIVAQAMSEPLRLISRDEKVVAYSDTIITW